MITTPSIQKTEELFHMVERESALSPEQKRGQEYFNTAFPGVAHWKIYSVRRVFSYLKKCERELGEKQFKKKPLYQLLLDKGLTLDAMATLTQDRYQQAPITQFINDILTGKMTTVSDYAITQHILSWFKEQQRKLPTGRKKREEKEQVQQPQRNKVEQKKEEEEKEQIQESSKKEIEQKKMERFSQEEVWKLLRAGEKLFQAKTSGELLKAGTTITSYVQEQFPEYTRSQILAAERIVRELSRYQKTIRGEFQFEHRPLYFQLSDAGLSFYTLELFTRERYQLADIPALLKDILQGTIEHSHTSITKLLEEQSRKAENNSPIPISINEEKEEEEESVDIEVSEETPAQDIDSFVRYRVPWQPRRLPLPKRFPPVLMPAPDGKRDAIIRKNQQITPENFDYMKIYVVAQGSNGRLVVSTRRAIKTSEHYAWKYNKLPDHVTQETIVSSERRAERSKKTEQMIEKKLHAVKLEMDQIFRAMYPELNRFPNKQGNYEYPHLISFREVYAWERSDIIEFLKDKGYIVVALDSSKLFQSAEIKGHSRKTPAK